MKRGEKIIIVLAILVAVLAIANYTSWFGFSSKVTGGATTSSCYDSDSGINYYVLGKVSYPGFWGTKYITDSCTSDNRTLIEAYCDGNSGKTTAYNCSFGCAKGVCVCDARPTIDSSGAYYSVGLARYQLRATYISLTQAKIQVDYSTQITPALSEGQSYNFSKGLKIQILDIQYSSLGASKVVICAVSNVTGSSSGLPVVYPTPPAGNATIEEQVKCVFNGTSLEKECYSTKASCSGIGTCSANVEGTTQGERVLWKSTCSNASSAYSTMDKLNESVNFNCMPICTEGEYKLTNLTSGHYYGIEQCVNEAWVAK